MQTLNKYSLPDFTDCKRLIAVGDIHGQLDLLAQLIEREISFDKEKDILVFLGDYIDRGRGVNDERDTVNYLISLYNNSDGRVVLLKGNHEEMAELALSHDSEEYKYWWNRNGCSKWEVQDQDWLLTFVKSLPLFVETQDYIFVHAGAFDSIHPSEQPSGVLLWERYGNQTGCLGKKLVVGHTPRDNVLVEDNRIGVDTGAFYSGKLSAYDVINSRIYEVKRE